MAINTTGNNGSVVGVTGVHPDNIGKGILWDEATKSVFGMSLNWDIFANP